MTPQSPANGHRGPAAPPQLRSIRCFHGIGFMGSRQRRATVLLLRALQLRCPWCGRGSLYASWFRMYKECPACRHGLEPEPGFYLGSIYINYGVTALVVAIAYPLLHFRKLVREPWLMVAAVAFAVLFPLFFHRYARSLWLALDQWLDPEP